MIDESMEDKPLTGAPWEFASKSFWQKILVISAGVIMNMLLGIFIYFLLTWRIGIGEVREPIVGYVVEKMPAAVAGIQVGDRIVTINGDSINTWQQLTDYIHPHTGDTLIVGWLRNGKNYSMPIVPEGSKFAQAGDTVTFGRIGINPKPTFKKVGFFGSIANGFELTGFIITQSFKVMKMLIVGRAGMGELAGPIGIAQLSGESIRSGPTDFLSLIAQISVSIGLLNIMPFPVLDGGHVIFISIEAIIRRQISTKVKMNVQKVGLALILAFFLFVSYHDIMRIIFGK
jgi:regulator of sigma E protease